MGGLMTVPEAAAALDMHPDTLYRLLKAGELPGIARKVGGRWKVSRAAVDRFLSGLDPASSPTPGSRPENTTSPAATGDAA